MTRTKKWLLSIAGLSALSALACCGSVMCLPAWARFGMVVNECPDGDVRALASASVYGVERGREGTLSVNVQGMYWHERYNSMEQAPMGRFSAEASLLVDDKEQPLECRWEDGGRGFQTCLTELPEGLPDGDYILRVHVDTPTQDDPVLDLKMPLYSPALAHVLTDRPLYEGGDTVRFRALTLREPDLTPLDNRPGVFTVTSPDGEVVLEERNPGGPWGVSDSSLPLPSNASAGTWTVAWSSGSTQASATFEVRPFELPRMTVQLLSEEPWYRPGDRPVLQGQVVYSSGAPVPGAALTLNLSQTGEWPVPYDWQTIETQTEADGSFSVPLSAVPADLIGLQRVAVSVRATDDAGDEVRGGGSLVLSRDPVVVDAVTELADGLVADFNNRVYLRITTPDGRTLADQKVTVRNAWDARDAGKTVNTDADGVLAMQVDPGRPINLEVPAVPVRTPPKRRVPQVNLTNIDSLLRSGTAPLDARGQAEVLSRRMVDCGWTAPDAGVSLTLGLLAQGGRVTQAEALSNTRSSSADAVRDCVQRLVGGAPMADGVWRLNVNVYPPEEATALSLFSRGVPESGGAPVARVNAQKDVAEACVRSVDQILVLNGALLVTGRTGSDTVGVRWIGDSEGLSASEKACLLSSFEGLRLDAPASEDSMAVMELRVTPPSENQQRDAQPTITTGFEFLVDAEGIGSTRWRAQVGQVPDLRLRPSEVMLDAGANLEIEVLRSPTYSGNLPDELSLEQAGDLVARCPRTPKALRGMPDAWYHAECPAPKDDNVVRFKIPEDVQGFVSVRYDSSSTVVWVRPKTPLTLALSADKASYAPGETAILSVKTSLPAVVSLTGVDSMLGQLVSLPEASALNRLTAGAEADNPAFGLFDPLALASGQVRGANAALAAIQRISRITRERPVWVPISTDTRSTFDPVEELTSNFYDLLSDVMAAVRGWENTAKEGDVLTHEITRDLWRQTLQKRESEGLPTTDAFGRRLELWRLPPDLLALTFPNMLVRDATHLPEDAEPWPSWVYEEKNR